MALERITSLPVLKPRIEDGHKGLYGTVLVIAGGRGMAGAAALCGASALRSGAGLVRVATPAEVQPTVASFEPCYMTYPLSHDADGLICLKPSIPALERLIASADVVAVGPGLGQSGDIRGLIRWLIESTDKPMIIDADGLNSLAPKPGMLSGLTRAVVITPHPGFRCQ
jgi:NAD(P)H-hydrate epimerase